MFATVKIMTQRWSLQQWVSFCLSGTLFTLPLSSTGKSIALVSSLILLLLAPDYRRRATALLPQFWCKMAFLFVFMAILACFWGPASISDKLQSIEKYAKLLYLPLLVAGFASPSARWFGIYGLLLGLAITAMVSVLQSLHCLPYLEMDPGYVFRNHIITSHMMAFGAYMAAWLFIRNLENTWLMRGYAILFLLFSYQILFLNTGRTGYVVYLLLMLLLLVQTLPWRKALIGASLIVSAFILMYFSSTVMQEGAAAAKREWLEYHQHINPNTSIGYRLQFHTYARELFYRHPILGNGTHSFAYLYHKDNPVPAYGPFLQEPHSQYWLVATELGMVGEVLFILFLCGLLYAILHLKTMKTVAFAIFLPFLVGSNCDSLLFFSGSGYFFIMCMALCLGELYSQMQDMTQEPES